MWILPLCAVFVACMPLLLKGYPRGHDWIYELVRASEYRSALTEGQVPPVWAGNLYGGYGSPVFLFYAPLYMAITSLFAPLTGGLIPGAISTLALFTAVSALGIFFLVREAVDSDSDRKAVAGRMAVYLYVLSPYLLGDKFLRNASAEFAALCLLPLSLYGVLRLRDKPARGVTWIAIGLGLTILAHNLTALVAMVLTIGFALVLYVPERAWRALFMGSLGVLLALGISATLWLPALALRPLIRTEELLSGKFNFRFQFIELTQLFGWQDFYSAGPLSLLLLAIGVVGLLRKGRAAVERRVLAATLAGAATLVFLMLKPSAPVWDSVPLMPLFQFPWRLVGPLALLLTLGGMLALAGLLEKATSTVLRRAERALFGVCVIGAVPVLSQVGPLPESARIDPATFFSARHIRQAALPATVGDEYAPRTAGLVAWRRSRGTEVPEVVADAPMEAVMLEHGRSYLHLHLQAQRKTRLRVLRWAFPQWWIIMNGRWLRAQPDDSGTIFFYIPPGEIDIELLYRPPPVQRFAFYLSLISLAALGLTVLATRVARDLSSPGPGIPELLSASDSSGCRHPRQDAPSPQREPKKR